MGPLAAELGKSPRNALGKTLAFAHCRDVAGAQGELTARGIVDGDVILIKGSNSVGLGALVASLAGK